MSVVSVVCCQVEVSATSWSLVQRSPTECGASFCVIWKPREWGGRGPMGGCGAQKKTNNVPFNLLYGKSPVVFGCKYWSCKIFKIPWQNLILQHNTDSLFWIWSMSVQQCDFDTLIPSLARVCRSDVCRRRSMLLFIFYAKYVTLNLILQTPVLLSLLITIYRVIRKFLCTWRFYCNLQVHSDFLITLYMTNVIAYQPYN